MAEPARKPEDKNPAGQEGGVRSDAGGMPHNYDAEQGFLGAVFINNAVIDRVRDFLEARHFYDPLHGRIYDHIVHLLDEGRAVVTPTTLRVYFEKDPDMRSRGGMEYMVRLMKGRVSLYQAEAYGRIIHELSQRRDLLRIGQDIHARASEVQVEDPPSKQVADAEADLYRVAERSLYEGGFQEIGKIIPEAQHLAEQAHQSDRHISGLPTHLLELDEKLGGLQPSDLIIIAGRTGMGKTSLALTIAANIARAHMQKGEDAKDLAKDLSKDPKGGVVGFFSLEMSSEQLALRLAAERAGVPADKVRKGQAREEEFEELRKAFLELHEMPLHIDDTGGLSLVKLLSRSRRLKREHKVDVIFVDYLQLVTPAQKRYGDNRVREVGEITQGLKALAKDLNVPVVALAQLSRAVDAREDKRPQLSDLRESGAIEQDADIVLFVHRDEYYLNAKRPKEEDAESFRAWQEAMGKAHGKADIIVGKHRHGPTGAVELYFNEPTTSFANLDRHHQDAPPDEMDSENDNSQHHDLME